MAADTENQQTESLQAPLLSAENAVNLAKDYLINSEHIDVKKYEVSDVSYVYFSHWKISDKKFNGEWRIFFEPKEGLHPGSELILEISNSKQPNIHFSHGM